MTTGLQNVITRQQVAIERFIAFAVESAGLSRAEAEVAFKVMRKARVLKIDVHGAQFSFTHGAFADADVLRRAAKEGR